MTQLQIALDDPRRTIPEAVAFVRNGLIEQADILELGTPMFYRWGLEGLRQLRYAFPDAVLLADLKLVDGAARLIPMAAEAGADMITVSGCTSEAMFRLAVKTAHACNVKVLAEAANVNDLSAMLALCRETGTDAVCYGPEPKEDGTYSDFGLRKILKEKCEVQLAYAGGVSPENAKTVIRTYHPEILIAARGIEQAEDPRKAAEAIRNAIRSAEQ